MRQLISILFGIIIIINFTSCAASKEEVASRKLKDFLEALKNKDFKKAKENADPSSYPMLDKIEKTYLKNKNKIKPDLINFEIEKKEIKDKNIVFDVKIKVGDKENLEKFNLVNTSGNDWVVVIPKENISLIRNIVFCNQYNIIIINERNLNRFFEGDDQGENDDNEEHKDKKRKHRNHGHEDDENDD